MYDTLYLHKLSALCSHELRTPLNSAFLGLKHVLDMMRNNLPSWSPDDKDQYDTLTDVHHSCLTAVDILVTPKYTPRINIQLILSTLTL